jgi:hypothetical protein
MNISYLFSNFFKRILKTITKYLKNRNNFLELNNWHHYIVSEYID